MHLISRDTVHPLHSGEFPFNQPLKDSTALSDSSIRWGVLCFGGNILVIFVLILLMLPVVSSAQTEFEGEVSGEWDTDGSPYIQVGNAQVPADESLTILPGVEVILGEDMTLTCNGVITAQGTEEDTIRIHGPEGLISGRILLQSEEDTTRFAYCRFDSLDYAIWFEDNRVIVEHNFFINNRESLRLVGGWVRCRQNYFHSDSPHLGDLKFGLGEHAGSYTVEDNFSNLQPFLFTWANDIQFNGNSTLSPEGRGNNISSATFWFCQRVYCSGNNLLKIHFDNSFRRLEEAVVENNRMVRMSFIHIGNWGLLARNNVINEGLYIADANVVVSENVLRNWDWGSVRFDDAVARLDHNLLEDVTVMGVCELEFINNTFVNTGDNDASSLIYPYPRPHGLDCSITLRNNIVANLNPIDYAVYPGIEVVGGGYNCFTGFEQPYGDREELLEGDIIENPLMRGGLPYDYRLRVDSPCLDAGDPDSPRDPDDTRADIGCFYFDQENGEPPALDRHWDYYIGWHETFRYAAEAVDEGDELDIRFEGLPEWLEVEEDDGRRDFVRDSVVVSGEVPEGQEDFVFRVMATDDADREDTLSVRVTVYPYRVLTGVVRGVLDVEQSPFIVADTAWVPAGDSLILPPGTELYFDNRADSLADRSKSMLMVLGSIKAVGEEGDSVYFAPLDTSRDNTSLYYGPNEVDFNLYRHCIFDGMRVDYSPIENSSRYLNSSFRSGRSNLQRINGYNQPYEFSHNIGSLTGLFSQSGSITENDLQGGIILYYADSVEVLNNNMRGLSVSTGGARNVNVQHNDMTSLYLIWDTENFIIHDNKVTGSSMRFGSSITVNNNLIYSPSEIGLYLYPNEYQKTIFNNLFINSPVGIYYYYGVELEEQTIVQNNLFLSSDTLVKMRQGGTPSLAYNAFYDTEVLISDTTYLGALTQVNTNGDSCDANFNIYLDPRLADPDSLDFRLYNDSPLIDAGNPDSSFNDVDSTINDIGLFGGPYGMEYEYLDPNEVLTFDTPPRDFHVGNAYPNPFNAASHISINIPYTGKTTFSLFDIQGRRVAHHSLQLTAGSHRGSLSEFLNMDVSGLRSGLYVLTVEFGRNSINRKLVLVK